MNYVYILECSDGTLYTGWTNDIEKRLSQHNNGLGAKYTRARRPVVLKHLEEYENKIDAQKREHAVKLLSRKEKLNLFNSLNKNS